MGNRWDQRAETSSLSGARGRECSCNTHNYLINPLASGDGWVRLAQGLNKAALITTSSSGGSTEKERPPVLGRGGASLAFLLAWFGIGGGILIPQ